MTKCTTTPDAALHTPPQLDLMGSYGEACTQKQLYLTAVLSD